MYTPYKHDMDRHDQDIQNGARGEIEAEILFRLGRYFGFEDNRNNMKWQLWDYDYECYII